MSRTTTDSIVHLGRGGVLAERFRIVRRLASGGMAEVYLADMLLPQGLSRQVAIKRIHPHLLEHAEFVRMFLDEARLVSQLSHPGVVAVFDVIEHRGELFQVLEYVAGWDLASVQKRLRKLKLTASIPHVIYMGQSLADTLVYVHGAVRADGEPLGIVHRDLNPSNVMLDREGNVRLIDFGVAKARDNLNRSSTHSLRGKFRYMSPEQALGRLVDARTDLYGLGLVMYELLAGVPAIRGDTDLAALEEAKNPHITPLKTLNSAIPAPLCELVETLLSADVARRPARGEWVLEALDAVCVQSNLQRPSRNSFRDWLITVMRDDAHEAQASVLDQALAEVADLSILSRHLTPQTAPESKVDLAQPPIEVSKPNPNPKPPSRLAFAARPLAILLAIAGVFALWWLGRSMWQRMPERRAAKVSNDAGYARSFLVVQSEPANAQIWVDNRIIAERTPAVVSLRAGARHQVAVRMSGYADASREVNLGRSATEHWRVTLTHRLGRISVETVPSGARVKLDHKHVGSTPLHLAQLARKDTLVEVEHAGYETEKQMANLLNAENAELKFTLKRKIATGTLDVSSNPWAEVKVDGRTVAESTPVLGIRLAVGTHLIELRNPSKKRVTRRRIQIREGKSSRLIVSLD